MSADGPRKGGQKLPDHIVRPQPVTERTFMESVAGLINEVGLTAQQYNASDEAKHKVLWTKIDSQPVDLRNGAESRGNGSQDQRSLLVTLGYATGVQMWMIPATGEAEEVLSWRRSGVKTMHVLPNPGSSETDEFAAHRPVVLMYDVGSSGTGSHNLSFVGLRSGDVLKTLKYNHAVHHLKVNSAAIVVSFLDKVLLINPRTFEVSVTINASEVTGRTVYGVPIALGPTCLAFGDRRVLPSLQSAPFIESLFVLTSYGTLIEYSLEPIPSSDIPKDKITDDAAIDLSVHATAQWTFTKPSAAMKLQLPFSSNSTVLNAINPVPYSNAKCDNMQTNGCDDESYDEHWLSQVEISTHSAPCRKLWMGPQFTFKVFSTLNSNAPGSGPIDIETVEVSVTNRPAKSKPVKMPTTSVLIPEISSSEDSNDPSPSSFNINLESLNLSHDSQIKENLAEAMLENINGIAKPSKGSSSSGVTGSCEEDFSSSSVESEGTKIPGSLVPAFCIENNFPD